MAWRRKKATTGSQTTANSSGLATAPVASACFSYISTWQPGRRDSYEPAKAHCDLISVTLYRFAALFRGRYRTAPVQRSYPIGGTAAWELAPPCSVSFK